jgi:hypothetical protein
MRKTLKKSSYATYLTLFRNSFCQCCGLVGMELERNGSSTKPYFVLQMGFFRRKEKEELEALTKVCVEHWKKVI